jgi:hypothetical protein
MLATIKAGKNNLLWYVLIVVESLNQSFDTENTVVGTAHIKIEKRNLLVHIVERTIQHFPTVAIIVLEHVQELRGKIKKKLKSAIIANKNITH